MPFFLEWKDKYITPTVNSSYQGFVFLPCPTRLAYGTIDSQIGKLRTILNEFGKKAEWDPSLLLGNTAADLSLKQYLKAVTTEQLKAQATPKQATTFFVNDLLRLSLFIDRKIYPP